MSYNSDRISRRDVERFKEVLDNIKTEMLTPDQQLAFAEALVERANELRQRAIEVNEAAKNQIL